MLDITEGIVMACALIALIISVLVVKLVFILMVDSVGLVALSARLVKPSIRIIAQVAIERVI